MEERLYSYNDELIVMLDGGGVTRLLPGTYIIDIIKGDLYLTVEGWGEFRFDLDTLKEFHYEFRCGYKLSDEGMSLLFTMEI